MKILFASVIATVLILNAALEDYCDPKICKTTGGNPHIACNNSGKFVESCPPDAKLMDLTPYIPLIVKEHNDRRNKVAAGNVTGYESAKRMAVMQWDQELADVATFNVKKCECEYDGCRNVRRFQYTGQNIVLQAYTGKMNAFTDKELIQDAIENWFEEYVAGKMDYMREYPNDIEIYKDFSHFALMITEANHHVGCAASRYKDAEYNNVLFTCNYASACLLGLPIYKEGPAGSGCKHGKNSTYTALCTTAEKYF
ncbi:antigen 5 like allergen Cul n 1 [Zeugodacus cucurbitae]|uniref:Venom allergen 5 n=1 Tax=Zeugodacus cucurbitae TaxID=28588 RepID=A0A0A1WSQ7_ZEUCU|nr:antigen 5 like allergen Cul n 1 [Zeugodacus cucurbitae]